LGSLQSIPEVDRVAGMQLSVVAYPRTAVAADHDPMSVADRPYRSYNVGDIITVPNYGSGTSGQRVRAITGSEDDDGEVTYSPELGDLILEEQERVMLAVKKMSDGTLEGESAVAQPTRVYVSPIQARPIPKVKTGTLRYVSTRPGDDGAASEGSGTSSAGFQSVTLVTFRVTPAQSGPDDGTSTSFRMWQHQGGESITVAEVDIGNNFIGGTTYTGTIFEPNINLGDGTHRVSFDMHGGNPTGPVYVEAIFAEPGETITLSWGLD
jgi:hypothetical protein